MQRVYKPDIILADIPRANDPVEVRLADVPSAEKLEKFVEDVRYEIFNYSFTNSFHSDNNSLRTHKLL